MTGLYWAAAALALLAAAHAAARLRRDRSAVAAAPVLCMCALGAALILTALTPALTGTRPEAPDASFAAAALGLLGVWELTGGLSVVTGDADRPGTLMAVPVLGAVSAGVLQMALEHAAGSGAGVRLPSGLPVAAGQLVLLTYYLPALVRTAALAWRCARRIPVRYIDVGMRAVAVAAIAELALIAARAGEVVEAVRGVPAPGAEAAGVGAAQGVAVIAVIAGVTATAWFPLVESGMFQGLMWAAWWRLGSLHAALVRAAPEVRLPPEPGTRFNVSFRLNRRVVEIRDSQIALRPYLDGQVTGRAADAARLAGLPGDRRDAVIEAAGIAAALAARAGGAPRGDGETAVSGPDGRALRNDLRAEAARLLLVSRAMRRSPIVRRLAA
jgi:hypothetical protein